MLEKTSRTDRFRGPNVIVEKWTNAKAARIAYDLGRGYSSTFIARKLRDGTSASSIRRMIKLWRLPKSKFKAIITSPVGFHTRKLIEKDARARGISPDEWTRKVLTAVAKDGIFDGVTEGIDD